MNTTGVLPGAFARSSLLGFVLGDVSHGDLLSGCPRGRECVDASSRLSLARARTKCAFMTHD